MSSVNHLIILELSSTSVLECGDSACVAPSNRSIAVQRERAIFWENEFTFDLYPIFQMELPQPPVEEQVHKETRNESPVIQVNNIQVSFVAASSIVHIGSSDKICADARIKHVRHLMRERV